jgi:hypothetical protein
MQLTSVSGDVLLGGGVDKTNKNIASEYCWQLSCLYPKLAVPRKNGSKILANLPFEWWFESRTAGDCHHNELLGSTAKQSVLAFQFRTLNNFQVKSPSIPWEPLERKWEWRD